jgi:hypothetical protein
MAVEIQSHMIAVPKAFIGLRIVQLVFAVIIFGISIYGCLAGSIPGPALNLFTVRNVSIQSLFVADGFLRV